ncbi:hypothetical protein M8C21_010200 [Ambrosia artemisiifolia]|uniref:Uncharacterized protein n=1 Tax=Ambrosia artemisiifolia TaxID=4212 RepID=A0AAD5CQY2_AMBAR|nr:hypothetical protein M8C21_010200 [Ambrosia artemisiifolia]
MSFISQCICRSCKRFIMNSLEHEIHNAVELLPHGELTILPLPVAAICKTLMLLEDDFTDGFRRAVFLSNFWSSQVKRLHTTTDNDGRFPQVGYGLSVTFSTTKLGFEPFDRPLLSLIEGE